jgi:dienelactone hydrolase
MFPSRITAAVFFLLWAGSPDLLAEEPSVELRYDLRPGDHLIYQQSLEREVTGVKERDPDERNFSVRAAWTSHVLVTGESSGNLIVGFQRNRTQAEMLRYREKGRDRLEEQRPEFDRAMADRPRSFAEANWITPQGELLLGWSAVREYPSILLLGLREVEPVPTQPLRPGDAWTSNGWISLPHRVSGWDRLHDENCLRIEGRGAEGRLQLRYWFCPSTGTLGRLEFEGSYGLFGLVRVQEKWSWELVERRRQEEVENWLLEPDLRQGALAALLASESLSVGTNELYALLESKTEAVARQVLALAYRHHLPPPEQLGALLDADDPRLRTLAIRLLESVATESAQPLIERALADPDYFVRQAGLDWLRSRLPAEEAVKVKTASDAPTFFASLDPLSLGLGSVQLSATSCTEESNWSERVLRERRFPPQPPGATLRTMETPDFAGRPYVVYVPEDYRGDQPFPLVVYLSGSGGRAAEGVLTATRTLPQLGYLVVVPDAQNHLWWEEEPPRVVAALLDEILRSFNVDTNRLYLTGFSNGGTGAFYYATLWPHRLAAAALLMGSGIYSFDEEPLPLANLGQLPLLFLHGDRDERIHVQAVHDTVREVRRQAPSAPTEVHIFEGEGHNVTLDNDQGLTVPFLQQHVRNPFPRRLDFQTRALTFPRHYWVEILEKKKGLAKVKASIQDDNTLKVDTRRVKRIRLLLRRELFPRQGPVRILLNGKEVFNGDLTADCELLQKSWQETADPFLAYSAEFTFDTRR